MNQLGAGGCLPPVGIAAGGVPATHPPHRSPLPAGDVAAQHTAGNAGSHPRSLAHVGAAGALFRPCLSPRASQAAPERMDATSTGRGSSARAGGEVRADADGSRDLSPLTWPARGSARMRATLWFLPNSPPDAVCGPAALFVRGAILATHERWTDADKAALRIDWRDPRVRNDEMEARFGRTLCAIRAKAQSMRLGTRPKECDGKHLAALARRAAMADRHARRRAEIAEMQAEAEQEAPEPEGIRETPRLARARELLGRGISVASLVAGLRLTALEAAALRGGA